MRISLWLLACSCLLYTNCDKKRVYDEYQKVGESWHKDSVVTFNLPKLDSTQTYNLFVNVRNNKAYEFNNLYVLVNMEFPGGLTKADTLEYEMADADGNLLGDGFSDVKDSKLWYKENVRFTPSGAYKVRLQHAMRKNGSVNGVDELKGVTHVGFRIETTE